MTLTESQAERVVGAFAAGADWALAARILSIPRSTLRRWIEADAGYIPSIPTENPTYAEGSYAKTLDAMPEPFRSQLKHGDFTIGLKDDPFQVIPTEWVRAAQKRWTETPPAGVLQMQLGVDLAHGGADSTTIIRRFGPWLSMPEKLRGTETDTGQKAAAKIALAAGGFANLDVIGIGASAYDIARGMSLAVRPVNFGAGCDTHDASGTLSFANVRAFAYWHLRERLDPNAAEPLMLPPDPEVLGDLTAPRFSVRVSGIQVEAKADIKGRIGRSPDVGDAVVLAVLDDQESAFLTYLRQLVAEKKAKVRAA